MSSLDDNQIATLISIGIGGAIGWNLPDMLRNRPMARKILFPAVLSMAAGYVLIKIGAIG